VTGLEGHRVYLDWNATAPLRPEARAAMIEAMDVVGNPSSVHAEGREARKLVETARERVAALVDCAPDSVVFTSGATEANAFVAARFGTLVHAQTEHDSIVNNARDADAPPLPALPCGRVDLVSARARMREIRDGDPASRDDCAVSIAAANAEVGTLNDVAAAARSGTREDVGGGVTFHTDATQQVGKLPFRFDETGAALASCSAHKLGGPKGVGALLVAADAPEADVSILGGGGQERGRRSGTENVVGIVGFGMAAAAARRDLEAGAWERVERLRNILEERLAEAAPDTIFLGRESPRLPNTSCFASPGWIGETQVMQMDLAGFAVSAGSACSSGKVNKASRALRAMGLDEETASSAIRISIGPATTEAEVMAFADAWTDACRRREAWAA